MNTTVRRKFGSNRGEFAIRSLPVSGSTHASSRVQQPRGGLDVFGHRSVRIEAPRQRVGHGPSAHTFAIEIELRAHAVEPTDHGGTAVAELPTTHDRRNAELAL